MPFSAAVMENTNTTPEARIITEYSENNGGSGGLRPLHHKQSTDLSRQEEMTPEMAARQQHKQSWQQVETMNPFNPRDLADDDDNSGAVL